MPRGHKRPLSGDQPIDAWQLEPELQQFISECRFEEREHSIKRACQAFNPPALTAAEVERMRERMAIERRLAAQGKAPQRG